MVRGSPEPVSKRDRMLVATRKDVRHRPFWFPVGAGVTGVMDCEVR